MGVRVGRRSHRKLTATVRTSAAAWSEISNDGKVLHREVTCSEFSFKWVTLAVGLRRDRRGVRATVGGMVRRQELRVA